MAQPPERRRGVLSGYGITADTPVRLYCNTARRLSLVYAVLRKIGIADDGIFEGGIRDCSKHGGPVEATTWPARPVL